MHCRFFFVSFKLAKVSHVSSHVGVMATVHIDLHRISCFRCALAYQREILVPFQGHCLHGGLGATMMGNHTHRLSPAEHEVPSRSYIIHDLTSQFASYLLFLVFGGWKGETVSDR